MYESIKTPTQSEIEASHTAGLILLYRSIEDIRADLIAINSELKFIREKLPYLRSRNGKKDMQARQQDLFKSRLLLTEHLAIAQNAGVIPMIAMAKRIEEEFNRTENEAPTFTASQKPRITDEELKALYTKYED